MSNVKIPMPKLTVFIYDNILLKMSTYRHFINLSKCLYVDIYLHIDIVLILPFRRSYLTQPRSINLDINITSAFSTRFFYVANTLSIRMWFPKLTKVSHVKLVALLLMGKGLYILKWISSKNPGGLLKMA